MNCENCGQELKSDKKFCGNCGQKVQAEGIECPRCKTVNSANTKFCSECGEKFSNYETKNPNIVTESMNSVNDDIENLPDEAVIIKNNTNFQKNPIMYETIGYSDILTYISANKVLAIIMFVIFLVIAINFIKKSNILIKQGKEANYEIIDLHARWAQSDWIELQMTVKNLGSTDINNINFKVSLLDNKGLVKADFIKSTGMIPYGNVKGPILINGNANENVNIFQARWQFELYAMNEEFGTWRKIKSGDVENQFLTK